MLLTKSKVSGATFVAIASLLFGGFAIPAQAFSFQSLQIFSPRWGGFVIPYKYDAVEIASTGIWDLHDLDDCVSTSTPNADFGYVCGAPVDSGTQGNGLPTNQEVIDLYGAGDYLLISANSAGINGITSGGGWLLWNTSTGVFDPEDTDYRLSFDYSNTLDSLNTRFLSVALTDGPGNDTVNFNIQYFLDESEYDPNVASRNPTVISIEYAKRPATTFSKLGYSILPIAFSTSTETGTITGLSNGTFDVLIRFSNAGVAFGGDIPFSQSYVYTSIVISGGQLTSVGALEFYDGRKQSSLGTIVYRDCSLTQFDNCISNAFLYLFAPSADTLSSFSDLGENIQTRFPFVYVYQFSDVFTSMFDTTQNQSLSIVIPFAEAGNLELISEEMLSDVPFSSLIRTILASIMWLLFLLTVYRKTLRIYDNTAV